VEYFFHGTAQPEDGLNKIRPDVINFKTKSVRKWMVKEDLSECPYLFVILEIV
jgi:hypothetical protein